MFDIIAGAWVGVGGYLSFIADFVVLLGVCVFGGLLVGIAGVGQLLTVAGLFGL